MPPKIFHLRVFKKRSPVGEVNPFLVGLNLDQSAAETTADLLTRHLRGAALRDGAHDADIHLYHLEVRDIDANGEPAGQVLFRWVLPAAKDVE